MLLEPNHGGKVVTEFSHHTAGKRICVSRWYGEFRTSCSPVGQSVSLQHILIYSDNRAGTCAAWQCYIMKFLADNTLDTIHKVRIMSELVNIVLSNIYVCHVETCILQQLKVPEKYLNTHCKIQTWPPSISISLGCWKRSEVWEHED
jgi:hypothetical protein